MLTALDREEDKIRGLDAGADDYITKPFSTDELLARIRANMRRAGVSTSQHAGTIRAGELEIDVDAARVRVAGKIVELRTKEYKLLVALASRPGALATRQWLAEEVWGSNTLKPKQRLHHIAAPDLLGKPLARCQRPGDATRARRAACTPSCAARRFLCRRRGRARRRRRFRARLP